MKLSLASLFLITSIPLVAFADEPVKKLSLSSESLTLTLTPNIGGRVLSVARNGQDNILKVGDAVQQQPAPHVHAGADNIAYLGHEIWVGPQSAWWLHQSVNPARAAEKAVWPPDPWLGQGTDTVIKHSAQRIELESQPSPVSGLQLRKRWQLIEGLPDSILLEAEAVNTRDEPVAWDLWFNTRLHPQARAYVPVANKEQARFQHITDEQHAPLDYQWYGSFLTLNLTTPQAPAQARRGKVFIQPDAGWMAGFYGEQVLIIHFPLQPEARIHPEQGQIELYLEYFPGDASAGLLEMEVHAPYEKLAPGQRMSATEIWTLLPYLGQATAAEETAFLREQIPLLEQRLNKAGVAIK